MAEEGGDAYEMPEVICTQLQRLGLNELYNALYRADCELANEWRAADTKFRSALQKVGTQQARRKNVPLDNLPRFTWANKGELAEAWFVLCGATERVAVLCGFERGNALCAVAKNIHAQAIVPQAALPVTRLTQKVQDYLNGGAYNGSRGYQVSAEVREVAEGRRPAGSVSGAVSPPPGPAPGPAPAAPPAGQSVPGTQAGRGARTRGSGGRRGGRGRGRTGVAQVVTQVEEIDDDTSWDWDLVHQVPAPSPKGPPSALRATRPVVQTPQPEAPQAAPQARASQESMKAHKSPSAKDTAKRNKMPTPQRAAKSGTKESTADAYVRTAKQATGAVRKVRFAGDPPAGVSKGAPPAPPAAGAQPQEEQQPQRLCHPMKEEVMASALMAIREVQQDPKVDKEAALQYLAQQFAAQEAAPSSPPPAYSTPAAKHRRVETQAADGQNVSRSLDATFASQGQGGASQASQGASQSQDVQCSPPPPYPQSQSTQ